MTLSGGEKRRLSLARCLCTDPKLLLLDEPFVGIDPIAVQEIHKIIRELRDRDGLSILITDHQVRETLEIVDRASLLVEGKVMIEGSSDELVNDENARRLYFGSDFRW
jgi:lipopolysaccharide export system ATP-binding protein